MNLLDLSLNDFDDTLLAQSLNIESGLTAELRNTNIEIETVQGRISEIDARYNKIQSLKTDIGSARQDRAAVLAVGQEHIEISQRISALQAELQTLQETGELLEDEKHGLTNVLKSLQSKKKGLTQSLEDAEQETSLIRYCITANEYNKKAEDLAGIVKSIWDQYTNLPDKYRSLRDSNLPHPKDTWWHSCFSRIPILRMNWPQGENDCNFFLKKL